MAIFRKILVTFWEDNFVSSLTPERKFFYLYLLTNARTKQCGIYEFSVDRAAFETGYNRDTIEKMIDYFVELDKVKFSKKTGEIAIKNWPKHNSSGSPKVKTCIESELAKVKDEELIGYVLQNSN
jgi:hypothetical protein